AGYMKPIATLMKPLRSVDLATMTESPATVERSDVCAVPAAAVVAEAMVAFVLADAAVEKFGGDSIAELAASWRAFHDRTAARFVRNRDNKHRAHKAHRAQFLRTNLVRPLLPRRSADAPVIASAGEMSADVNALTKRIIG